MPHIRKLLYVESIHSFLYSPENTEHILRKILGQTSFGSYPQYVLTRTREEHKKNIRISGTALFVRSVTVYCVTVIYLNV